MTAHKKSHFQFHLFCYLSFPITRSSLTFSFLLFFTLSLIISSCFLSFPFLTSTNPSFSLFLRLSSFLLHFISFHFLYSLRPIHPFLYSFVSHPSCFLSFHFLSFTHFDHPSLYSFVSHPFCFFSFFVIRNSHRLGEDGSIFIFSLKRVLGIEDEEDLKSGAISKVFSTKLIYCRLFLIFRRWYCVSINTLQY